jgi:hypothetical protein
MEFRTWRRHSLTVEKTSMRFGDHDMPGHKVRRNKDGTVRHGWVARHDLVKRGYRPKWVRLHYNFNDQAERLLAAAQCQKLQAEMLAWASGMRSNNLVFDGTVAALVRAYQRDPASPYCGLKWNTRRTYDQVLGLIEKAFGQRALAVLRISDFRRWYDEAAKPKVDGGRPRVRKAHGIISMFRRLFSYGISAELPECARLVAILLQRVSSSLVVGGSSWSWNTFKFLSERRSNSDACRSHWPPHCNSRRRCASVMSSANGNLSLPVRSDLASCLARADGRMA